MRKDRSRTAQKRGNL